jgi:DNA-binding Lrp family transcriptional regulator
MKLNDRDRRILGFLEKGAMTLKPLFNTMPKSAVYDRLAKLTEVGYVFKDGKRRGLTSAGRATLKANGRATVVESDEPSIESFVAHIALAPTRVHRALLTLIAAAIVARLHRIRESHHPSFVLMGPKLTWKSWLAKLACWMAGIDAREFVLNLGTETPGSLIQRRGAKGQVVTKRLAISQPVMGLDELGRAKADVMRIVKTLLYGDLKTPFENDVLETRCVPIVMLNPRTTKAGADLTEILGLDEGTVRRSVVADLKAVEIPKDILTEGDGRLDQARALGGAEFPAPRDPEWDPSKEVQAHLLAAFDRPQRLADVDFSMVALMCTALTAWLPRVGALRLGVRSYLEIVETLGWVKDGWRSSLPGRVESVPGEKTTATGVGAGAAPAKPNTLDFTAKASIMLAACKRLGLSPVEATERISRLEKLGLKRLDALDALDKALGDAGVDLADVGGALDAGCRLAAAIGGEPPKAVALLRGLVATVIRSLPADRTSAQVRAVVVGLAKNEVKLEGLKDRVALLEQEVPDLECRRKEAAFQRKTEVAKLAQMKAKRNDAQVRTRQITQQLAQRQQQATTLEAKCNTMRGHIARACEHERLLAGELDPNGPFAQAVLDGMRRRRGTETVKISEDALKELFDLYVRKLDGQLVPVWELRKFADLARREAAKELRKLFEGVVEGLQGLREGVAEKLRAADDAVGLLRHREI